MQNALFYSFTTIKIIDKKITQFYNVSCLCYSKALKNNINYGNQ